MKTPAKKWTKILDELEVAPSIQVTKDEQASVSSTMSRITAKGIKEFVLKQSKLSGEILVLRLK